MAHPSPFVLLVSMVNGKPVRFQFDQPRVLVGRGLDADLRIEHAGVSRLQFLLERGTGSAGEPRFRITPFEVTNPTYVNGRPAVEGTITPGDVVAVSDVRVLLEHKVERRARKREVAANGKEAMTPMRLLLILVTLGMFGFVVLLMFREEEGGSSDLTNDATKLFNQLPPVRCANPTECDVRAHDAYARSQKLQKQYGADPGNLYRAVLELDRAARFRTQSGLPLADLGDVDAELKKTRAHAESEFQDARFRLSRAISNHDYHRAGEESSFLARFVPDDQHPYRIKLDAYRRTLPTGEKK